jgi:hypothetical protein
VLGLVEERGEQPCSRSPRACRDRRSHGGEVEDAQRFGLPERGLDVVALEDRAEVERGARGRRDAERSAQRDVAGAERAGAVGADALEVGVAGASGDRDLDMAATGEPARRR